MCDLLETGSTGTAFLYQLIEVEVEAIVLVVVLVVNDSYFVRWLVKNQGRSRCADASAIIPPAAMDPLGK